MCAQICTWLKRRGHEVLVLTAPSPERGIIEAASDEDEGPVSVRRTLCSYWDGSACLGFPLVFVIGDDWLCYGGWTDAWFRWCNEHSEQAPAVEQHTGLPTRLPDLGALGIFCFVSAWTRRRAEQIGGWHFPRAQIIFPGLSPTEFPPLVQGPDRPWRWRLLWVGRVIEEKGIETAIHALSLLSPHATLEID